MNEIASKIDEAFNNTFLFPREKVVTDFLIDVLNPKYKFRENNTEVEIICLGYEASSPLNFLFIQPHPEIYAWDPTIQTAEISLADHSFEDYSYFDIEDLCRNVLDKNNIDYSEHLDEDDELETEMYWENQFELEKNFLLHCWKNAKQKSQSNMIGTLEASDNGNEIYDLDSGDVIPDDIDAYLQSKDIIIKKEI